MKNKFQKNNSLQIKSTKSDLSIANAAESMGHSVKIHQDNRWSTFAEKDAREFAAKKF